MSKKTWLILLIALFAVGILLVCGAGAALVGYRYLTLGRETATPIATATTALGENTKLPTTVAPGEQAQATPTDGELHLLGSLPPTLDPALVQDTTSGEYVVHIFAGLVSLDADLEVVPALAESWDVSDDGRTFTFYLHPDAAFGDGRAITSADVVGSLERACSPELQSPVALSYLGDIVGAEAYAAGESEHISGLEAVDAHTVRITIDSPKGYFLAKLTYPTAAVVDLDEIDQDPEAWFIDPNPSGPFALKEVSRDQIVLVRNDRYVGRKPSIAKATYSFAVGVPVTQYETGEIDITSFGGSEIDRILDPYNSLNGEYLGQAELSVQYIGFNVEEPPFDDPLVRQAFAYALDRDKLAELVMNRTAIAAYTILPPTMPGYASPEPGTAPSYDPDKARQLLAQSSYGSADNLPPIALTVPGTSAQLGQPEEAVLAMWSDVLGVNVTVEQVEWADMLQDMNVQRFQAYTTGWIADYPDPQNFIDVQFHSGSSQNHTGYANAEVDELLEQARVEQDEESRMALYRKAELVILNEAPWIPLTHGYSYYLVKPYIQGFRGSGALYPWLCDIAIVE